MTDLKNCQFLVIAVPRTHFIKFKNCSTGAFADLQYVQLKTTPAFVDASASVSTVAYIGKFWKRNEVLR